MDYGKNLDVRTTGIPGLLLVDLPVHGDNRGWFKENWQRAKMVDAGLPDFRPIQQNISFNETRGTTRGIHAEPWDKYVSVATGSVFGVWVDLREGPTFGATVTATLDPGTAVFVPRGVGNAFQTLEDATAYTYLVTDHWSADAQSRYTFLNLEDETVAIDWPIRLSDAERSAKDLEHPRLADVVPMPPRKVLVLGAGGQLGRALGRASGAFGGRAVELAGRTELDVTDAEALAAVPWRDYDVVVNASAFTKVDAAETPDGRRAAWEVNVAAVARLARLCAEHGVLLVHVSSDYVFDGTRAPHAEDEPLSPLGVYGQTKAAADALVATVPRHYIVRTSWVVGDGPNFVRTMRSLAERGVAPSVVADQIGRLTFTEDLADAIAFLVRAAPPSGVYNVTNSGAPRSWADIARAVFRGTGHDPALVTDTTAAEYGAGKELAPRPADSTLALDRLLALGFAPRDQDAALAAYLDADAAR
jgi:dTDP-4-dehydrorhamnose 3,5-epimerase/reductase